MLAVLARTRSRHWFSAAKRFPIVALTLLLTQVAALAGELIVGRHRPFQEGDQAVIEIHLRQAMRGAHLLGPYSQYDWYHPGPLLYYFLTPLYVLSGSASRSLYVTAGLINFAGIGLAIAVVRRNEREPWARRAFELLLTAAVAEFVWDVPPGALVSTPLTEVWNPAVTVIPMLALTVVGAAVAAGSLALTPLLVVLHAFVAQTHISHGVSATVVVMLVVALCSFGEAANRRLRRRWLAIGAGVGVVLWFPPLLAWLEGRHGNISALVHFALHPHDHVPLADAFAYALARLEHPLLGLLRADGHGWASTVLGALFGVAQLAGVVLCQRTAVRTSAPFASALALTAWAPVPVALLQASALPSLDPQFYYQSLWYGPVGCLAWYGLAVHGCRRLAASRLADVRWAASLPAVPALLLAASIWPTLERDFARCAARGAERDGESVEDAAQSIRSALEIDLGGKRLALDAPSPDAWGVLASVLLELGKLGADPPIHPRWRFMFGSGARYSSERAPTINVGLVDQEHGAPLWRAYARIGLYSSAFRAAAAPGIISVQGEGLRGDPLRLVTATKPAPGSAADAENAVFLPDGSANVTVTLPLARVGGVQVVAGGNDSYVVQASLDGVQFRDLERMGPSLAWGLQTRETTLDASTPLRALRIRPEHGGVSLAHVELEEAAFACALVDASGAGPNPGAVCDGKSPKPNRAWNARGAVILDRTGAQLTLALPAAPGLGFVDGVMLEGDGNDTYSIDGSLDGTHFSRIGTSALQPPRSGIQRWPFYFNDGSSWSYLRIAPVGGDGAFSLAEIRPLVAEGTLVDFRVPSARSLLRDGWSADEQSETSAYAPALAPAATLEVALEAHRAYEVTLRLRSPDGAHDPAHIAVEFAGQRVTEFELLPGAASAHSCRVPAGLVQADNEVRFVFGSAIRPGPSEPRRPAAELHSLLFRPVLDDKR